MTHLRKPEQSPRPGLLLPGTANRDEVLQPRDDAFQAPQERAVSWRARGQHHLQVFRCPEGDTGLKGQPHECLDRERKASVTLRNPQDWHEGP